MTADTSYSAHTTWADPQQARAVELFQQADRAGGGGRSSGGACDHYTHDTRGCAVSEVCIVQDISARGGGDGDGGGGGGESAGEGAVAPPTPARTRAFVHGRLSSGQRYAFWTDESQVGHETPTGWWVKAALPGERYLMCRGEGFTPINRICTAAELKVEQQQRNSRL